MFSIKLVVKVQLFRALLVAKFALSSASTPKVICRTYTTAPYSSPLPDKNGQKHWLQTYKRALLQLA
jgi:hypothetical protein